MSGCAAVLMKWPATQLEHSPITLQTVHPEAEQGKHADAPPGLNVRPLHASHVSVALVAFTPFPATHDTQSAEPGAHSRQPSGQDTSAIEQSAASAYPVPFVRVPPGYGIASVEPSGQ